MTDKDRTIQNQAKVIKDNWSELQTLKRILIDKYPDIWREIKNELLCSRIMLLLCMLVTK